MAQQGLTLDDMDYLSPGKKARLYRMLYEYGPGHGKLMILPIDQGLEHGPRDFFENPDSIDPEFQYRLAVEGHFSAIALQIGLAEKYYRKFAGQVPLIVKINGKTEVPPDDESFSPMTGSVLDAVRLGADAAGYTCYVGSASQDRDFIQFNQVRMDAEKYGMPVIMWAYPRGKYVEAKGGKDSLWAVDYAARVAQELGADVVKVNFPKIKPESQSLNPKPYNTLTLPPEEAMRKVVASAGRTLTLVSGGEKKGDEDLHRVVQTALKAGVTGFIFGRNIWQRKYPDALKMSQAITESIWNTVGAKEASPKSSARV
ncbi:MAG: fructose-bisphosphate aldolase [Candidatus Omnitrophica bacterium]|nr:fructose-bisphosphate aldolase [Candidatus Omnitrophota bacterium]